MNNDTKNARYERIYNQLTELLTKTDFYLSRMATITAVLHHKMDYYFWTGFYLLHNDELLVASYQGSLACQKLEKNKGVCWAGINQAKTIIVTDVHQFDGHIACDSRSQSEIVVPIFKENKLIGVLDVDSTSINSFNEIDAFWLEKITALI